MHIRPVEAGDRGEWLRMRTALWPEGSEDEHAAEIDAFLSHQADAPPTAVLVCEGAPSRLRGFAELSIRSYAEGCRGDRVAYLEGWYVDPEERGRGVGRALVAAAEAWGRARGCHELASDTELANDAGHRAHLAVGFEETARIICFRKPLDDAAS
jgi:aminoglycoside 6'-N-acetyltransferase I